MKVGILRTWLTNIGNGFIDKGAESLLYNVAPDADLYPFSGYSLFAANKYQRPSGVFRSGFNAEKLIHGSDLVDLDVIVIPGCVLYEHALGKFSPVLEQLRESDTPILLLGVGGGNYETETKEYVQSVFQEMNICGFISRDHRSYDTYRDVFERVHEGIDCAFWIDEYHSPPPVDKSFTARTFDKMEEPNIPHENIVIRPHHNPFEFLETASWKELLDGITKDINQGQFIADNIDDYLFIYANAEETHTDRIHAAVPSLVYGNKAKFYYDTPRANLFEAASLGNVNDELVEIDNQVLRSHKEDQEKFVQTILENI